MLIPFLKNMALIFCLWPDQRQATGAQPEKMPLKL